MTLRLVDPTVTMVQAGKQFAPRLASLSGQKIGVLSNGKENADRLLALTAAHFADKFGCTLLPLVDKGNASRPCPPDMLKQLAGDADLLLTAVGD